MTLPGTTRREDLGDENRLQGVPASPGSAEHAAAPPEPAESVPVEARADQAEAWPPRRELWIETGVVLLVSTVPHVFHSIWFHWLPDPQVLPFAYIESAYLVQSVALGALALHCIWRGSRPPEEFGMVRPTLWDIPGGIVVLGVAWSTAWVVIAPASLALFPDATSYHERIAAWMPRPQSAAEYGLLALSCAAVGLQEEITYRGYLLPRLTRLTGSAGAAFVIATGIFALVHIYQGPHGVISSAWFGIVTGALFLAVRRIWPLALAHGLWNFLIIGWLR